MRYMGWSYDQLLACPDDYIEALVEESRREKQAAKERARR